MSYLIQAEVAEDGSLWRRATACAASEGVNSPGEWASEHRWALSAQPGWVAAFASAAAARAAWTPESETERPPEPGANEAAITDGMILAAVQALVANGEEGAHS